MCLGDLYYMRGSFKDMLTFRCNTIRNACPCQSVMLTDLIVRNHIIKCQQLSHLLVCNIFNYDILPSSALGLTIIEKPPATYNASDPTERYFFDDPLS